MLLSLLAGKVPPALVRQAFDAVRLDYDRHTDTLWLSVVKDGRIKHHELPIGITFAADEIAAWLNGEPLAKYEPQAEPAP